MFRHVVNFKVKNDKKDMIPEAKKRILELTAIPQVKNIEVGIDEIKSKRSFDFSIIVDFGTREDYNIYDKHDLHLPVKKFVFGIIEDAAAVDYNI